MPYAEAVSLQISICSRRLPLLKSKTRTRRFKDLSARALSRTFTTRGTILPQKTLLVTLWPSLPLGLSLACSVSVTDHQQTWMTHCCSTSIISMVTTKDKPVLCIHHQETYAMLPYQAWNPKPCKAQLATSPIR